MTILKTIDYINGVIYQGFAYGEGREVERIDQLKIDAPAAVLVTKEVNGYQLWTGYVSDRGESLQYMPNGEMFEGRDDAIEAAVEKINALRAKVRKSMRASA